jgi:hypothetical protein
MDNLDPQDSADNLDPAAATATAVAPAAQVAAPAHEAFSWKAKVGPDLSKAPSLGKFSDTPEGLAEVAKSYVNLEKLLGHEKVPLPKGPDDVDGRAAFNKAIGVPPTPEQYNLPDAVAPKELGQAAFDKSGFQQVMHKHGLSPDQAKGLWKDYTEMTAGEYTKAMKSYTDTLDQNINALRREWGDAYAGNVELGDMVINKFADDQKMADFLTSSLSKDPAGLKFLAKIGQQFAENKVGEFQYKRFAMTPQEAKNEVLKIKSDPNHPYSNEKATEDDHQAAVDHVNRLISISMGKRV